jgi:hypothetical protein
LQTWQDLKSRTKTKSAVIKRSAIETGGGPLKKIKLSNDEDPILQLIKPVCVSGLPDARNRSSDRTTQFFRKKKHFLFKPRVDSAERKSGNMCSGRKCAGQTSSGITITKNQKLQEKRHDICSSCTRVLRISKYKIDCQRKTLL